MNKISLSFPQKLLASDLRILLGFCTLALNAVVYRVKEYKLSIVTYKILGSEF